MRAQEAMLWFTEVGTPHELHQFAVTKVLFAGRTAFQHVLIVETQEYGKMLIVDDRTQSAEEDEAFYHEALVHPALVAHPAPRRVLIIGGGEGATAREVFRHPSIERVVMVDIDRDLVEQCMKLLPEWHEGAFDDPRLELVFADGKDYIEQTPEKFDVVIVDVCDALEEGPALALYTERFYSAVKQRLTDGGLLVVQAMELSGLDHADHVTVHRTLHPIYHHVSSYATFIPSFWASWGFIVVSDTIDVGAMSPGDVDGRLRARGIADQLEHYDGQTHAHMFALPRSVRTALANDMT
jgi:spermidine synthase